MQPEHPAPSLPWSIDPELRAILVCPACRGELTDLPEGLHCPTCALLYPVVSDIPQLISEEARPYASAP